MGELLVYRRVTYFYPYISRGNDDHTHIFLQKKPTTKYHSGAPGIGGGGINVPLLMMLNRFLGALKKRYPP